MMRNIQSANATPKEAATTSTRSTLGGISNAIKKLKKFSKNSKNNKNNFNNMNNLNSDSLKEGEGIVTPPPLNNSQTEYIDTSTGNIVIKKLGSSNRWSGNKRLRRSGSRSQSRGSSVERSNNDNVR